VALLGWDQRGVLHPARARARPGVSESVLEGVVRALQLDEAERAHLIDLVRTANASRSPQRRRTPKQRVRPGIQHVLDGLTGAAAIVHNARLDNLATNQLGHASTPTCSAGPLGPVP
jgi:MmyB-like transcription regulator ligand binding domain